jgi:hypothetical protein
VKYRRKNQDKCNKKHKIIDNLKLNTSSDSMDIFKNE